MGMIIKTVFNNQNWSGKCKNAEQDKGLFKCREGVVGTGYKVDENGNCIRECWEHKLCTEYSWQNNQNRKFNKERTEGKVFFIHWVAGKSFVLWGTSRVKEVKSDRVYFEEFEPMLPDNRINLSAKDIENIVGKWGNGIYRFLNAHQESKLKRIT